MTATLPTTFISGHEPSYAEMSLIVNAVRRLSNKAIFNSIGGCSLSTTSASFVAITGATINYTKLGNGTQSDVFAFVSVSARVSAQPNNIVWAIQDSATSTTYTTHSLNFNTANAHRATMGAVRITGLTNSSHTFNLVAKVSGGATATIDSNDTVMMMFFEVPL